MTSSKMNNFNKKRRKVIKNTNYLEINFNNILKQNNNTRPYKGKRSGHAAPLIILYWSGWVIPLPWYSHQYVLIHKIKEAVFLTHIKSQYASCEKISHEVINPNLKMKQKRKFIYFLLLIKVSNIFPCSLFLSFQNNNLCFFWNSSTSAVPPLSFESDAAKVQTDRNKWLVESQWIISW